MAHGAGGGGTANPTQSSTDHSCFSLCLFTGRRLLAFAKMQLIRRRRLEVVFAAVLTRHGITDLVHGAQVKPEVTLLFDGLAAQLADKLQPQT